MFMDTRFDDGIKIDTLYKNDGIIVWKAKIGYGVEQSFCDVESDINIFGHHVIWWFEGATMIKDESSWKDWKYWTDKDADWLRAHGISLYEERCRK